MVRYLTYAVGEVVLIIVGIVLALQLNNWNEDRKAQVEFDAYILHLKEDVRAAIENVEASKSITESFRSEVEYVPAFLQLSDYGPEELEAFEKGIFYAPLLNTPQLKVGHIGQLINGNMDIINRDQELARIAVEMVSFVEGQLDNIQRNGDQMELVSANRLSRFVGFGNAEINMDYRYNLERLKSDEEFLYVINYSQILRSRVIGFDENIAEKLEAFLTVLEEYE